MNKRKLLLYLIDTAAFFGIYFFAALLFFVLPFETHFMDVDANFWQMALNATIVYLFIIAARIGTRIYTNIWRYASSPLYLKLMVSDLLGSIAGIGVAQVVNTKIPLTFSAVVALTYLLFTLANRMLYRRAMDANNIKGTRNKINVAIVGAGKIGVLLAKELTFNANSKYHPYCFIDSDTHKVGNYVSGIKVYPENDDIIRQLGKMPVQEIFIALPKLSSEEIEKVYNFYSKSNLKIKIYDLPVALLNDNHKEDKLSLREFKIEDLLFRDSIDVDTEFLKSNYTGKTILVTGGGGSIGSELCRQIARHAPKKLIILDIYENNAYAIEQYLRNEYGDTLDFCVEIASVRDVARLDCIFEHYKPDVVFHAAAHKHVPLMEHSSAEAVKNNVIGTYNTANMAEKHGVKKFILISTDKAVNPTNVMGASKRMCEMIVQCRTDSQTSFVAVRFGNVLGSNGSVIPLFKTQIERGGPITLTDKRIIRYFMTIPEASQLVMYAGVIANRGELFVLDMGKPIKILDLAENMVRLSGLTPYKDIDIIEIGLRPGEKLYEELLIKTETLGKTANKKIFIEHDTPLTRAEVDEKIAILKAAAVEADKTFNPECIKEAMKKVVPSYKDPEKVNCSALQTDEMKMAGVK
ncbi:MAG: polysaccharide biosynthesis protein [Clostridia bacterium]|nr:polysaccharide biosynthesis protein [Clostridia bacterium]